MADTPAPPVNIHRFDVAPLPGALALYKDGRACVCPFSTGTLIQRRSKIATVENEQAPDIGIQETRNCTTFCPKANVYMKADGGMVYVTSCEQQTQHSISNMAAEKREDGGLSISFSDLSKPVDWVPPK